MAAVSARRTLLLLFLVVALDATAQTRSVVPASSAAPIAWTLKMNGNIHWQQVTPAGALLVSTDRALAAVDMDRGQVTWEKSELGGLPADSVRPVESSLLMEAARPGLLLVFDPITGAVVFDSQRLGLTQVITRRVLPRAAPCWFMDNVRLVHRSWRCTTWPPASSCGRTRRSLRRASLRRGDLAA